MLPDIDDRMKEHFLAGLRGDEKSYAEFLELAGKLVRSNLRKTIPAANSYARDPLEDLVQDVLLAIHQKRGTFRAEYPILPWVFAIARHRWIDIARMISVRPELLAWDEKEWEQIPDEESRQKIEHQEAQKEAEVEVANLLEELSPKQKQLIRLAKLEKLPLNEVALRLGISLSSVKVGVHRFNCSREVRVSPKKRAARSTVGGFSFFLVQSFSLLPTGRNGAFPTTAL